LNTVSLNLLTPLWYFLHVDRYSHFTILGHWCYYQLFIVPIVFFRASNDDEFTFSMIICSGIQLVGSVGSPVQYLMITSNSRPSQFQSGLTETFYCALTRLIKFSIYNLCRTWCYSFNIPTSSLSLDLGKCNFPSGQIHIFIVNVDFRT